ncbi:MAG TPA: hypothetical protein VFQ61_33040, partial [Polyangiaceae bacterium]|nr:hypothetical protein [Polyangiaceae bacterium]
GKPTLTMPHLEVGDYIETERIESQPGDGRRGAQYMGPRWYFREENIAYARSEFVVISPKSKPLAIETRNDVSAPEVKEDGAIIARRWRVDLSPAAPVEPFGAPVAEFMPSVQVGWGVNLPRTLEAMGDASADLTPVDPRVARIARRIVEKVPTVQREERARVLYRWLVTNVQEGEESDGRRVVIGQNGNLWRGYIALCRAVGLDVQYAVTQNRLTLPPTGPFSEASQFTAPLMKVVTEKGDLWLSLGSKYAPFGYVPSELRGMPAYILAESGPKQTRVPETGVPDRVTYEGDVDVQTDGSANVDLAQTMQGKYGMALRNALSSMSEQQIHSLIETRLIGNSLRGAKLVSYELVNLADADKPLTIRSRSRVPSFAQVAGSVLLVTPPFGPRVGQLAALPVRQTPLLIADSTDQSIRLHIKLPKGTALVAEPAPRELSNNGFRVRIQDHREGEDLVLERSIYLPAGRVQIKEYAEFLKFARSADDALSSSLRFRLKL